MVFLMANTRARVVVLAGKDKDVFVSMHKYFLKLE